MRGSIVVADGLDDWQEIEFSVNQGACGRFQQCDHLAVADRVEDAVYGLEPFLTHRRYRALHDNSELAAADKFEDLSQLLEECVFAELDSDDDRALIVAKMVPIARLLAIHFSEPSSRSDLEGDLTFARSNMSEPKQALVELRRFRPDDGV